ncbi:MAG: CvpA family protein [Nevskiaceae bacterium]|nr:MAG: CvpA family protein [Nevskiaceae bacterium]TBR74684.1 MAG: CvpA family protein [Nevskiaceae bacterium]
MNWIDYAMLAGVAISTVAGLWRGFTRELFSFLTWIAAFGLSALWGPALAPRTTRLLGTWVTDSTIGLYLSCFLVFVAVLVAGHLLAAMFVRLVRSTAVTAGMDRTLGGGVGFLRGALIVAAVVMVVNLRDGLQGPTWRASILTPRVEPLALQLQHWLPDKWLAPLRTSRRPPARPIPASDHASSRI